MIAAILVVLMLVTAVGFELCVTFLPKDEEEAEKVEKA
jgi:hypothetical protein